MKIDPLTIYLWQLADRLIGISVPIMIISGIAFLIFLIISRVAAASIGKYKGLKKSRPETNWDDDLGQAMAVQATTRSAWKWLLFVATIAGAAYTIIPESKTIAMMVVIPKIAESKVIQQDLPDLYEIAIKALKEQIGTKK